MRRSLASQKETMLDRRGLPSAPKSRPRLSRELSALHLDNEFYAAPASPFLDRGLRFADSPVREPEVTQEQRDDGSTSDSEEEEVEEGNDQSQSTKDSNHHDSSNEDDDGSNEDGADS
jgi:hypothetical protein